MKYRLPLKVRTAYGMPWRAVIQERGWGDDWPPLEQLQRALRRLKIVERKQYIEARRLGKLSRFPANPEVVYGISWSEITTGKKKTEWPPLAQFTRAVALLGIKTRQQYYQARRQGLLREFPSSPLGVYGVSWTKIVGKHGRGTEWPPIEQFQEALAELGICTLDQFRRARRDGLLGEFPAAPHMAYGIPWGTIVDKHTRGSEWPPVGKFRAAMVALGITTQTQYKAARRAGQLEGFPSSPLKVYGTWAKIWSARAKI